MSIIQAAAIRKFRRCSVSLSLSLLAEQRTPLGIYEKLHLIFSTWLAVCSCNLLHCKANAPLENAAELIFDLRNVLNLQPLTSIANVGGQISKQFICVRSQIGNTNGSLIRGN